MKRERSVVGGYESEALRARLKVIISSESFQKSKVHYKRSMKVRSKIKPGDIGYLVYLHGILYAQEYDLDFTFEGYVAAGLGEFAKSYGEGKDRLWIAEADGRIVGSIAIAGLPDQTAQLRWFLVHPDARGKGLGRKLLDEALRFCRERAFRSVFLWTISELKEAAHLYRQAGFRPTEQKTHVIWGGTRTEERYDLSLQRE